LKKDRILFYRLKLKITEFTNQYFYSKLKDSQEDILREITYSSNIIPRKEKIALIIPPSPQIPTPGREFLVAGPFEGFTYIATLIKKMGYQLEVIDCRLKENVKDFVIENVQDSSMMGIATYMDSFVFLKEITALLKEKFPDKLIFLGGSLVSSLPKILLSYTAADCAILGEAELTLIEFLKHYFEENSVDFKNIKGMAYKENNEIKVNPPRPQIKNLDNLPLLNYTIWPNYENIIAKGQILISSMRGCPMECTFCFKTIPALRLKSLERFEEEVAYLKENTKFDYTWLNDLTFNINEKRAMLVSEIMKKYKVKYHCFARVTHFSRELAYKLKETGCLGIWFGMESYNQKILDNCGKNVTVEDINKALMVSQEAGLAVRGLFIIGLYGETEESLKNMLDFIKQNEFFPLVKYLVPFPGTALYNYAVKTGKIKDVIEFLKMLSRRKIRDYDDELINVTSLKEEALRDYFHQIWNITQEREKISQ